MPEIKDNAAMRRFEMASGNATAFIHYQRAGQWIDLIHTEVPDALSGQGIGSALVRGVLDRIRTEDGKVIPTCRFVAVYIERHPEYRDMVADRV